MSKVYRHIPMSPDELLGHVEPDGKVYESRFGPDKCVGRVDADSCNIYETRFGPDKHIGRVALDSGRVYRAKLGPDEYLGRADADGKLYRHKLLAADEYLGHLDNFVSYAHAGAAWLLLVLPAWEERQAAIKKSDETPKPAAGTGKSP